MIEVSNLSFTPTGTEKAILKELSFSLPKKGLTSIVGPNGSGKTTLLRCLLSLLAYSGSCKISEKEASKYSRQEISKLISYIPQVGEHLPGFSVREFVELARRPHFKNSFDRSNKHGSVVEDSLKLARCESFSSRLITSLSGGERQRVFVAAALAQETPMILMDEPGAFLDPEHEEALFSLLSDLKAEKSIIVVSHDLNRCSVSSDNILALKDGEKFYHGVPSGLVEEQKLIELYNRKFVFVKHPECQSKMILPESVR